MAKRSSKGAGTAAPKYDASDAGDSTPFPPRGRGAERSAAKRGGEGLSSAPAGRPSALIDTRVIYCGDCTKPTDTGMFSDDWFPIQVKQMEKVGRPDVDAFEAAMMREERTRGFMVAFGFTSDAFRECTRFQQQTGKIIKLLTVQEILDEEHVQKM